MKEEDVTRREEEQDDADEKYLKLKYLQDHLPFDRHLVVVRKEIKVWWQATEEVLREGEAGDDGCGAGLRLRLVEFLGFYSSSFRIY